MTIHLVSGDGQAAGKTYFARSLVGEQRVRSLAGAIRLELQNEYRDYDWFNTTQQYKDGTIVKEWAGKTIRQCLYDYGQEKTKGYPTYWVDKLIPSLFLLNNVAVDDLRKTSERDVFFKKFPGECVHFHVCRKSAIEEPTFDNKQLKMLADYRIYWDK